jgi:hypothetical protein
MCYFDRASLLICSFAMRSCDPNLIAWRSGVVDRSYDMINQLGKASSFVELGT